MTAFSCVVHSAGRPGASDILARMQRAQAMYGRDRQAAWDGGDVALGINLMRCLPEDDLDAQPCIAGGDRYVMAGDFRIDNRPELAPLLELSAADLPRIADSAVAMRAWLRWGEAAVEHLRGNFAFVVWDRRDRRLFLARDQMGYRPLHYHVGRDFIAVASMPKGVLAAPEVPRGPDVERLAQFTALLWETLPKSFHGGVSRLGPGQRAWWSAEHGLRTETYWDLRPRPRLKLRTDQDYVEAFRDSFDRAVADRLRSAGPVGTQLSGGLDSGAVATAAAIQLAERGQMLRAYTTTYRRDFVPAPARGMWFTDEAGYAAAVASCYPNIDHAILPLASRQTTETFERHFQLFDRPVTNVCWTDLAFTTYEAASRDGIRTMLVGMAGNLTLSYGTVGALGDLLRPWSLGAYAATQWALSRNGTAFKTLLKANGHFLLPRQATLLLKRLLGQIAFGTPLEFSALHPDWLPAILRTDRADGTATFGPGRLDQHRCAMAFLRRFDFANFPMGIRAGFGIDYRDPTEDSRFVELCLSLPPRLWFLGGHTRGLARAMLAGRMPDQVRLEQRKGMQLPDWQFWLAGRGEEATGLVDRLVGTPAEAFLDLPKLRSLASQIPDTVDDEAAGSMSFISRRGYDRRFLLMRGLSNGYFAARAADSTAGA